MAARKPLFMNSTEGFAEELGLTSGDSLSVSNIIIPPAVDGGVGIDLGENKITNLGTPTDPEDGVNKAYVDALVSGLNPHEEVRVKTNAELTGYIAAGAGIGKTLTSPDNAVSNNTIDGVLLALNDRVLVTAQGGDDVTPDQDNGVYKVTQLAVFDTTPFVLTRVTDMDEATAAELYKSAYVFVTAGTLGANKGYFQNQDITAIDAAGGENQWALFSGAPGYTYDQGLLLNGSSIKVELNTAADAQGAGAGGGSSGLEFDFNTAAGKLRAAVHATGGLERTATGLAAKLNGTTLQSAAGGLSVKGLPSLFEINGVAVGATVTAAALDDLTDGGETTAHTHPAVTATEAPKVEVDLNGTGGTIAAGDPVYITGTNNIIDEADTIDAKAKVIGVARNVGVITAIPVVVSGVAAGVLVGATAGTPYYLATGGGLTTSLPAAAKRVIQCGMALNATDLFVRITDYGKKAA